MPASVKVMSEIPLMAISLGLEFFKGIGYIHPAEAGRHIRPLYISR
jgi:hypothetical protein